MQVSIDVTNESLVIRPDTDFEAACLCRWFEDEKQECLIAKFFAAAQPHLCALKVRFCDRVRRNNE